MEITRAARSIGIPGLYVTDDRVRPIRLPVRAAFTVLGLGWAKSHSFFTGQTPVMECQRDLMRTIFWDRLKIADIVNVTVISLNDVPNAYAEFDSGVPKKFVIDPHDVLVNQ
ncbi:hypothetical protein B0G73_13021 [Paraburkholderia sp. BL25I1N1]|nr:hypothetical protein B0G73_13021 [Paraburkholderia sp. BL25I1N1]